MKYAILSDIHGNEEALTAVLGDMDRKKIKNLICLGDIVGYGARPHECISLLRERNAICVAGNHDYFACGRFKIDGEVTDLARTALEWTQTQISESDREYLRNLEPVKVNAKHGFTISHGSLFNKPNMDYVIGPDDAFNKIFSNILKIKSSRILDQLRVCFIGHTHSPCYYRLKKNIAGASRANVTSAHAYGDIALKLAEDSYYVLNCGSVGQPRDGDPRAGYVIFNLEKRRAEYRRIDYNIKKSQAQIAAAKLPERLAERLERGR